MSELPPELKGRKVSEVFLEYVGPYLEVLMEVTQRDLDRVNKALNIPWSVWNMSIWEENGEAKDKPFFKKLEKVSQEPEFNEIWNYFKERKQTLFKQYDYLVGEFKFYFNKEKGENTMYATASCNSLASKTTT